MNELQRQYHELPEVAPPGAPSNSSDPDHHEVARPSAPAEPGSPALAELFRNRCMKCHEVDGTGRKTRERLPENPDFTNPFWQARRTDSKLLSSILDGKGEDMPAQRRKISEEQARGLVTYVRAFAPTTKSPGQTEQEGPRRPETEEVQPPTTFLGKLIRWLGGFHPPAVHFPIALLTAAVAAELLGIATTFVPSILSRAFASGLAPSSQWSRALSVGSWVAFASPTLPGSRRLIAASGLPRSFVPAWCQCCVKRAPVQTAAGLGFASDLR
jgi:mono/diheme cytochrome c family protein